jgi:hypothetical protein
VDYVEGELDASMAAAREGLPVDERFHTVVAALLLIEVVRRLAGVSREWWWGRVARRTDFDAGRSARL